LKSNFVNVFSGKRMKKAAQLRIAVRKFPPFERAIKRQWITFEANEDTGFELEIIALDLDELTKALFDQNGLKNGRFDVAFINTDWVASACERGDLLDITEAIRKDPPRDYPHGWEDSMLRLQRVGNFVAGLPYHNGPECLIYRRDLFEDPYEQAKWLEAYGDILRPPRTWSEFRRVAKFFQRPSSSLYGCIFGAYPDGHNTVYDFLLQLWSRGGQLFCEDGSPCLESPEATSALQFLCEAIVDSERTHPGCRQFDSVRAGQAFADGEAAMMINWFGFAVAAQVADNSRVSGAVSVSPVPGDGKHSPVSLNIYWLLSVSSGTAHPDISYRFIRHCADVEMDKLLTLEGAVGCRRSTWTNGDINAQIPFYYRLQELHENAREIPRQAKWPQINKVIDELVQDAYTGKRPFSRLLADANAKIAALDISREGHRHV
jgi:multiple sugar transport system substrate-binding protein